MIIIFEVWKQVFSTCAENTHTSFFVRGAGNDPGKERTIGRDPR